MDDHIIRFGDGGRWHMTIDLKELAGSAGIRKNLVKAPGQTFDEKVVSVPLPRAKKLVDLIARYAPMEEARKLDTYLRPNTKLYRYWRDKYAGNYL